jgi:colanic acid/amylovoran biosynthesis glycosyltransferase
MTPRRIAYVLKRFPRVSETFVAAELIELERQGETVAVFALSRPEEQVRHRFLEELSAPVVYLPRRPAREPLRVARALARVLRRDARGWLRAARLSLRPPRLAGWRRLLQATVLRDELSRSQFAHVHAHFASTAARLAHLARTMGGPTYSVTAHAKDIYHREVRVDRLREKLGGADFVTTVSRQNKRYIESVLDGRTRCVVVPNSVDLHRIGQAGPRVVERGLVVSVARLVEKKGLSDLIDACVLLSRPEVHLDIAGDGPQRAELEARARMARLPVLFYGALSHERVLRLVRRAAVFCLPCLVGQDGDRDGLPTAVLEAMALEVPVVTTAVNGLRDAVEHERTGLVVPERDPAALAAAIARLLDEPELARSLAFRARRRVERRFSLQRNASRLRSLFPEAM